MAILEDVLPLVDDIIGESRIAKKKGQRMENRLKSYRGHIEALGFERKGRK